MPPAPNTATEEPASTFAVFITAPTPVTTAHPSSAADPSGTSLGIFTKPFSWVSIFSAKPAASPVMATILLPRYGIRGRVPAPRSVAERFLHRLGWPDRHWLQRPQNGRKRTIT